MDLFLSLGSIFLVGFGGGILFEKIKLPKLIFYILLGILLGPSVLNFLDKTLLDIASYLRQVALVIILTRSGLSLDFKTLKKIGRPAFLMCFLPAIMEIIGISLLGPVILNISIHESLLLGSVLAAVSPAVVVPRMIKLQNEGYGTNKHVPELIMAGASCDDILVIVLFYSFKTLVKNNTFGVTSLLAIPLSIILGIILGFIFSFFISAIFKKLKLDTTLKIIILLGSSFLMIGIENILKPYISVSSLLAILVTGMIILLKNEEDSINIKKCYDGLWQIFEILLFVLVGAAFDVRYAFSFDGLKIILLLLICLTFRSLGVFLCLFKTDYNFKERLFIILAYLPKATVQASIGAIALSEGLACGNIILVAAVIAILICAPLGALLIDKTYKKLLIKIDDLPINQKEIA